MEKTITKQGLNKAKTTLKNEPKYIHYAYQDYIKGKNCYCTLGAIAAAHGWVTKFLDDDRHSCKAAAGGTAEYKISTHPKCNDKLFTLLDRLRDTDVSFRRSSALKAIDTLKLVLFGK